ncbi:hypothetical protein HEP73_00063 [Xanthomonas sp. GW]|uniref:hypothetical protein n=1 Tax=unclassified Xanthomonas TaxID=2643310 RepID=UPI001639CC37|nr:MULTISPECIES: hypothetical protein [unclassified Xanthomonas]QNH10662.1 hypothetical protein HEP75_00065 [Xanthomonas sp. SI]QNH19177.1 hypothetical protein HEP73_00063 [Xanthomonas sp. GW]
MRGVWLLTLLAVSAMAHAAPGDEEAATCRNGVFANSPAGFALAKVAVPRLYLLDDSDGCPSKGEAACRQRAYVVKGDVVVLAQRRDGFACAFYPNKVGGSAGWVAQESVQPLPSAAEPTPQAWNGRWHDGDNGLQLTANGDGSVTVNGDAYWPSANPDPEERPGGPNVGAVTARGYPEGNRVEVSEDDCNVRLQLLGDLLVVADNLQCGGANVSFGGVYRRGAAARR